MSESMSSERPPCFEQCSASFTELAADAGVGVTVSPEPPLVAGPYSSLEMRCLHGVMYWFEPSGEQGTSSERIARMAADLAAVSDRPIDEAVEALLSSIRVDHPPLTKLRPLPWYVRLWWRWGRELWRQRWILRQVAKEAA